PHPADEYRRISTDIWNAALAGANPRSSPYSGRRDEAYRHEHAPVRPNRLSDRLQDLDSVSLMPDKDDARIDPKVAKLALPPMPFSPSRGISKLMILRRFLSSTLLHGRAAIQLETPNLSRHGMFQADLTGIACKDAGRSMLLTENRPSF